MPSEKYAARRGSIEDDMYLITACFTRAYPRWTSRLYRDFSRIFQEVRPISKTRNQLLLIQPHGITTYHVIDAEIVRGIWTLDVRVPAVIHLLPRHRQQRRILFHDRFRLPNERLALRHIGLAVNLRHERLEGGIVPIGVILWAVVRIPGVKIVRGI